MNSTSSFARQLIIALQRHIKSIGFTPVIHFELEGCYQFNPSYKGPTNLNFLLINQALKQLNINGHLIAEYWSNQWEYVSSFEGQLPLKEADNLTRAIAVLPRLLAQQGVEKTLIKPVVWSGDKGKLAPDCANVFSGDSRDVHIPNAIQMNISVNNSDNKNIISDAGFGEYLQQCFLTTSLPCSLLYLPEEEAFDRFALKSKYGLEEELCSPSDISGGHQGSIALYKKWGKHNQAMGEHVLIYDQHHQAIKTQQNWQESARIEHRLGASSLLYNAYVNVAFALLNVIDGLEAYLNGACQQLINKKEVVTPLPTSLYSSSNSLGAIDLFHQHNWFAERSNEITKNMGMKDKLGDQLKQAILSPYQTPDIIY
jgi:hypothetical protein